MARRHQVRHREVLESYRRRLHSQVLIHLIGLSHHIVLLRDNSDSRGALNTVSRAHRVDGEARVWCSSYNTDQRDIHITKDPEHMSLSMNENKPPGHVPESN
jgi:hypothetical protein